MAPNIIWQSHPGPQTRFLQSGVRDVFYGGAAGGGKSDGLIAAGSRFFALPYYRGRIFRRSRTQATELILKAKRVIPKVFPGSIWRASEWAFIHPSGGRLEIGYLRHDDDLENEQGQEYAFVGFDELPQFPEHQPVYLFSRLRSPQGLPLQFKATGNPGGIGHLWVKARYIDPAPPETVIWDKFKTPTGKVLRFNRMFIPARLEDNPTLGDDYEISMSALDPRTYMALRLGNWDALLGQAFPDFDRKIHVMTWGQFYQRYGVPRIPDNWPRFMSIDWGSAKPFSVGWNAVDPFGRMIRYAEWYGAATDRNGRRIPNKGIHLPTRDMARGILEREAIRGDKGRVELRVADPAMWNKTRDAQGIEGPSLAEIFADEGVHLTPADNSRIAGKQQYHDRFRLFDLELPNGDVEETPGFFVMENCVDWLRTVPVLDADPHRPEDVDTDMEDHCLLGDTLVETTLGSVPIRDLVGREGGVWSWDGEAPCLRTFYNVRLTQRDVPVYRVVMADGRSVTATANHRFLLASGEWRELMDLKPGDRVRDLGSSGMMKPDTNGGSNASRDSREPDGSGIQRGALLSVRTLLPAEGKSPASGGVGTSQRSSAEGLSRSPHGSRSGSQPDRELGVVAENSTPQAPWRDPREQGQEEGASAQEHGAEGCRVALVARGKSLAQRPHQGGSPEPAAGREAVRDVRQSLQDEATHQGTVLSSQLQDGGAAAASRSEGDVGTGGPCLRDLRQKLRVDQGLREVLSGSSLQEGGPSAREEGALVAAIEPAGKSEVYNLEVQDTHCFAVNGGLIVHNCYDEQRYVFMARVWTPPTPITFKRWQKEYLPDRRGWKG